MNSPAVTLNFPGGTHITEAARQLIDAAKERGEAAGNFNEIPLRATPNTTLDEIVDGFNRECEARSRTYRASPEGIAAEREANERRADMQSRHDVLMCALQSLDFGNDVAVLDWCCAMQQPSDHVGVIVCRRSIVDVFAKHSFKPGVNCDSDFRAESRENVFRYLVGQALSGLDTGPAIHSIIHKFAAEWKEKFLTGAAQ